MSLTGHKRMHGQSIGKSKKIVCSCLITRKVMPYQNLEQYQKTLIGCKQCNKIFHPTIGRKTFCSQSCSATYNNKVYATSLPTSKDTFIYNAPLYVEEAQKNTDEFQYFGAPYTIILENLFKHIYKHNYNYKKIDINIT